MVERVFAGLLSARLDEIAQKPDAPFLDARDQPRTLRALGRGDDARARWSPDGGVEKGLAALFTEADRVARFGFTQTELDRYRLEPAAGASSSSPRRTTSTRRESLADEFIRNFMQQEPIPGIAYEYGLVQRFLPEITLADVNALARDWVPDRNRVVVGQRAEEGGRRRARRGEAGGGHQERRRRRR